MRQRRLFVTWFAFLLGIVAIGAAPSASAHNIPYGWWDCTQVGHLAAGPIRVGSVNLPADGYGDGVTNSFTGRAADATGRLSSVLAAANSSGNGLKWVGTTSSSNTAAIAFRMDSLPTGVLGRAGVDGVCRNVHGTSVMQLSGSVYISIAIRSDWFTQDDTRRAYWEGCPGSSYSSGYTCSKTYDFGSVALHEMGHAIGIPHPREVSDHTGSFGSGSAWALATCTSVLDQATMCQSGDAAGGGAYRTHRRTLHSWDIASIGYLY